MSLFRSMLVEEWRLHSRLFGGVRFALFPVFIAALIVGGIAVLTSTGTDLSAVLSGVHALVFLFGLQTGTLGFLGSDRLDSLLGDTTLLLSSGRTLPLSPTRIFGTFLVKEVVYYSGLFLLPIAVAVGGYSVVTGSGSLGARAPLLALTLAATFTLGIATTLVLVGLARRLPLGTAVVLVLVAGATVAIVAGVDVGRFTPYAFYSAPSTMTALSGLVSIPVLLGLGWFLYDPTYRRTERVVEARFTALRDRLARLDERGLVTRNLLEVHRSGGGLLKPVVSSALVATVAVGLVSLAGRITGVTPNAPLTLGALLGLTAFTTYNWLTQFDSAAEYRIYPVSTREVFTAKRNGFIVLTFPLGALFYVGVVVWFGGSPLAVVAGALLFAGLALYLFGLTVYLAGLDPNSFLFDTVLFSAFALAVSVPLVPVLVVGLVVPVTPPVALAVAVGSLALAGAGHLLFGRALDRWEERLTVA